MWGVSFLDVLFDILKFDGFKEQGTLGKIRWILIYIPCLMILIFLVGQYLVVMIRHRLGNIKKKFLK